MKRVQPKVLVMLRPPLSSDAMKRLNDQIGDLHAGYTIVCIAGDDALATLEKTLRQDERYIAGFVASDLGNGQSAEAIRALLERYSNPPSTFVPIEQTDEGPQIPPEAVNKLVLSAAD